MSNRILRRSLIACSAASLVLTSISGCSSAGTAGSNPGSAAATQKTSAECGSLPQLSSTGNADLSGLPEEIRAGYAGYFTDVNKSAYSTFKSKKTKSFTIGYSDSFSANSWRGDVLNRLNQNVNALRGEGVVNGFIATNSNLDNNLQIQQITSMINQGVDAIIAIPGSPAAFDSVIKQAFDAGIPFITLASHVNSPYAINIDANYFLTGVKASTGLAGLLGGRGSVVLVDGINGSPASAALHGGYVAGFKNCPNISVTGSVEGQWSEAATKTAVLQYLATNPAKIDGFVNGGGETIGTIEALEQSGREVVPIADSNPDKGSLLLLKQKLADKYVASTLPPVAMADAGMLAALATLLGQEPKYDAIVGNPPLVQGAKTLDEWIQPEWTTSDANQAPAPPNTDFLPADQFSNFFQKPGELPKLPKP